MFRLLFIIISINNIVANDDLDRSNHELMTNEANFNNAMLTAQLHKWYKLFSTNFEERLISIERNSNDLSEKSHVWDMFQLHFSAWNQQLASIDRKIDIISNTQKHLIDSDTKLSTLTTYEYKFDEIFRQFQRIDKILTNLNQRNDQIYSKTLRNDITLRDMRNTVKNIERIDFMLKQERSDTKCKTPKRFRQLLRDISSKIDTIFNKLTENESTENSSTMIRNKRSIVNNEFCNSEQFNKFEESINRQIDKSFKKYFDLLIEHFENLFNRRRVRTKPITGYQIYQELDKYSCEDLANNQPDGIYNFAPLSNLSYHSYHKNSRYCITRNNHRWTIIQHRNNFPILQNFNLSWYEYKCGFGDLNKDFWLGNDLIYELTQNKSILRIELEDFYQHYVFCEFGKFKILSEHDNYRLTLANYHGNASDSFTSHNGSYFSTYDKKNDQAPECCPCAVSYGGGWWFNSCFESNLNGIYHRNPYDNGHYGGLIWETWLGDYSLKKSTMMVRSIEDP